MLNPNASSRTHTVRPAGESTQRPTRDSTVRTLAHMRHPPERVTIIRGQT